MYPLLFEFGPFKVYSYGFFVALGFIVSTYLAGLEAQKKNIHPEKILNLALGLVISGILGARLLYVLQDLKFYINYPGEILMLHRGGLSFYGGFILATIFAVFFLKRQNLAIFKTFDMVCPYLSLAQAIGRIGCFLNGCCYGKPTSSVFSVYFPGEDIARHPTQLYSSMGLLSMFIILRIFQAKADEKSHFAGQIFLLYCLLYSFMRFFMEYLRGDNPGVWADLTIHQLISAGVFAISVLIWWKRWKNFSLKSLR